ncbi:MAG: SDR family oxidoreductase [Bacteroidota bacterium]|nr:SDR family oxidoreductase [Bacteroidota bacterium]
MNLSLEGKNAVICGSTQGIGFAIAEELALMGANCTLMARNETALKEALNSLDISLRQQHGYLVADFSKPGEVKSVIEAQVKNTPVQILINNTGGPKGGEIIVAKEEDFLQAFNQHLICNHILVKAVIPSMKEAGYGRIINIISTSVKIPLKNLGVSNTIRGAVASWAKTMANELGQYNITVNNILPGYTKTQRLANIIEANAKKTSKGIEDVEKEMMSDIPMKRFGEPGEIAAVAAFIASPAAGYVNGANIVVDGGRTGSI